MVQLLIKVEVRSLGRYIVYLLTQLSRSLFHILRVITMQISWLLVKAMASNKHCVGSYKSHQASLAILYMVDNGLMVASRTLYMGVGEL